jgi:GNAT superfamily N-acetyltransferase
MSQVAEPVVRVGVTVTFLRMDLPPADAPPALPGGAEVRVLSPCPVPVYRHLYDTVGGPYVWWLRRTLPDKQLAALLNDHRVSIHVLYYEDRIAGFYELDRTGWPGLNLSYFGLMPHAIGRRFGYAFLRHAVSAGWAYRPSCMTVNTCTADHPRAMPGYIRAGFVPVRQVREEWNVPTRLGLDIPEALRI